MKLPSGALPLKGFCRLSLFSWKRSLGHRSTDFGRDFRLLDGLLDELELRLLLPELLEDEEWALWRRGTTSFSLERRELRCEVLSLWSSLSLSLSLSLSRETDRLGCDLW